MQITDLGLRIVMPHLVGPRSIGLVQGSDARKRSRVKIRFHVAEKRRNLPHRQVKCRRSPGLRCLCFSSARAPSTRARSLLANFNFPSQINVICPFQSLPQEQFPSRRTQISTINSAVSSLTRGGSRSSRTRGGMRWTRQRQAREVVRRAVIRERTRRARRRR